MRRFVLYAALIAVRVRDSSDRARNGMESGYLSNQGASFSLFRSNDPLPFNNRAATSELAFVCNPENKYVGVMLIPFEGTFKNQQVAIPVVIQKNEDQYDTI